MTICALCGEIEIGGMVQCDICDNWFHFQCVNVDNSVADKSWICIKCAAQSSSVKAQENQSQRATPPKKEEQLNKAVGKVSVELSSKHGSLKSKRSLKMELMLLEEKRLVELKYLEKKHEIMRGFENSDESDQSENEQLNEIKAQRTSDWARGRTENHNVAQEAGHRQRVQGILPTQECGLSAQQQSSRHAVPRDLPTFSGKPEEWPLFVSSYENSTALCGFSNAENLLRLQKALKGKALDCVSSKLMIPGLVPEIIATLRMVFGRPEHIINCMIKKIRAVPHVHHNRLESVISFAIEVKNLTATMEATGLQSHLNNPMLLQELLEKLPAQMCLDWARYQRSVQSNNLKTFGDWMFEQGEAASSVTSFAGYGSSHENEKRKTYRLGFHQTDSMKTVKNTDQRSLRKLECYLCGGEHMMVKCDNFQNLSYENKWRKVKELKLCNGCLKRHDAKYCRERKECSVNGCTTKHHQLLHKPDDLKEEEDKPMTMAVQHRETSNVLYKVLPVTLYGNNTSCNIFAFLDDGSGPTLVEKGVLEKLQISGEKRDLCLRWTDGTVRVEKDSEVFNTKISAKGNNKQKFSLSNVRSVKSLDLPVQTLNYTELCADYNHLRGLPIASYSNVRPRMIIGLNNKNVAMPLKNREGKSSEPAAAKTRLGWIVYGVIEDSHRSTTASLQMHICQCDDDVALQKLVAESMNNDIISDGKEREENTNLQLQELKRLVSKEDDHFVVKLLWKANDIILPDNYLMALQRLKCFEKKMQRQSELKNHVNEHIKTMEAKGYARKLTADEIATKHPRTWYLPIFTVQNPNKPQKIRVVWDATAQYNGVSLNTCLDKGPDLLTSLVEVLWNFRIGKIGISADICEMFHRVSVQEDDQQSQRFMWRNCENRTPDVYVLKVLSFGASCSPTLAQFVKNENALNFKEKYPRAAKSIIERHYVDDMLDSVDTIDEAIQLAKDVRNIHKRANFHIRNWLSNSKDVLNTLGEAGEQQVFCNAGRRIEQVVEPEKVLGLWWETSSDMLTFSLKFTKANYEILNGTQLPTKRQLLRMLMSIFDPLGLLTFYLIDMKILFQKLWRCGIDWDDTIPSKFAETWKKWLTFLPEVTNIKVPRCYFGKLTNSSSTVQLHIFVDASECAYAAVAYLRIQSQKNIHVALVGSKAKVAPLRPISIPRMELMAAVMGTRFANAIKNALDLKIEEVKFWSDSKTVLYWLRSDPRNYKQFVMYRIGEIQEITTTEQWNYVPTKLNVADLGTKVYNRAKLELSNEWFTGPEFLKKSVEHWPKNHEKVAVEDADEIRNSNNFQLIATQTQLETCIDFTRFSKWERLLKCVAYVKRFITTTRSKIIARKNAQKFHQESTLTSIELNWSRMFLCQLAQAQAFPHEVNLLKNGENVVLPKSSTLRKLSPKIDEHSVIRKRSRLENATCLNDEAKCPIILPKDHIVTSLLIDWYHRKFKHVNHETVINEIFQLYYIPSLRRLCRTIRNNCQVCKVRRASPQPPEMGPLPEVRVTPFLRPFTYVGVDFFGPFLTTIGRRSEKRYGVLFTCLSCRAVHVEMAYSLSMSSCNTVIRNFIARRGAPKTFFSDNGTNLKASEKELRESLKQIKLGELQAEFTTENTSWSFIPPASPHMGGAWERMVRSIKTVLYQIVSPGSKLTDEKLHNLLLEVESIVNSRPLTYLSLDTAEDEALTPNHFLLGSSSGNKLPGAFKEVDQLTRESWRHSQYLADRFWKRWVAEVLPTLTRRTTWFEKVKPIEEGDVVIIVDPNAPRYSWPKGIIEKTIQGKDEQTRSVIVRTKNGRYHRPAAKIAVLDVRNQR